jgi:hypothetical protein
VLAREARKDLETRLQSYYVDEIGSSVIQPGDQTRITMLRGTAPGSFKGELFRTLAQFKSFPIAYAQTFLGPRGFTRGGKVDPFGMAHLIAGSITFGYIAMTAKDFLKGKTPRDPREVSTWLAAAVQGGGAGIYGDLLFGKVNRFRGGLIDTLAGPTAGTAGELYRLYAGARDGDPKAGDGLRLLINNTPFVNLWWTRPALDYAVLYHLQEFMSPGSLRNMERRTMEENHQKYIFPPSQTIQRGGGFR